MNMASSMPSHMVALMKGKRTGGAYLSWVGRRIGGNEGGVVFAEKGGFVQGGNVENGERRIRRDQDMLMLVTLNAKVRKS